MAAIGITNGLGIDMQVIKNALASFASTYEQNPGRFNIHDAHGFRVIMDYAHNPAALHAFFDMIKEMRKDYNRVIGHVGCPGDRRDQDINEVGCIAGEELDLVVFREGDDNRGRQEGEVNKLLEQGALSVGCEKEKVICVSGEEQATEVCLKHAQPGDIVILTPSDIHATWKQVLEFKPQFVSKQPKAVIRERLYA